MNALKFFLKYHIVAIIFSIICGSIVALPTILAPISLGLEYKGVPFLYQDNEVFYASRVKDVIDGNYSLGSPIIAEYKELNAPMSPTGEYLYAIFYPFLGFSLNNVFVASKIIFPAILFLLIYFFVMKLLGGLTKYEKIYAISTSVIAVLGYDLLSSSGFNYLLNAGVNDIYLSIWTRMVNPITGAIYLFAFLNIFYLICRDEKNRKIKIISAGVLLGIMTGYFFSFFLGLFVTLAWGLYFLIQRNYQKLKDIIVILVVGALVNFHTFIYIFYLISSNSGSSSPFRSGLLETNSILLNKTLLIATSVFIISLAIYRKFIRLPIPYFPIKFIFIILLASFFAMNFQVVFGYTIWPQHFVQYTTLFSLITVVFSLILLSRLRTSILSKLLLLILSIASGISFAFAAKTIPSYKFVLNNFSVQQQYFGVMNFLKENAPHGCVVLTNDKKDRIAPFVTIMTTCDSYTTTYVSAGLPLERVQHNYNVLLRMEGVKKEEINDYISANEGDIYHEFFFRDWKDMFYESSNPWLISISDRDEIKKWINRTSSEVALSYKNFLEKDLEKELSKNRVDYILHDSNSAMQDPINFLTNLELVYFDSRIKLYQFK